MRCSLLAPVIAAALIVCALSMPGAGAATLTIDDDVCTITYTRSTANTVMAEARKLHAKVQAHLDTDAGSPGADPEPRIMTRAEAAAVENKSGRAASIDAAVQGAPDYFTEAELNSYEEYVLNALDFDRTLTTACANGEAGNYPFTSTGSHIPSNGTDGIGGLSSNSRSF